MASVTPGECGIKGTPSEEYGENAWFRVQFTDGSFGDWIFCQKFCSKQICASIAALWCTCNVDNYAKALGLLDDNANIKQPVNLLKQNIR